MKRILSIVVMTLCLSAAFAEGSVVRPLATIAEITDENVKTRIAICDMPDEDGHNYYFCVGTLAMGDEVFQVYVDPVKELYLPLGETLAQAQATMESFVDLTNQKPGTTREAEGIYAFANPSTGQPETVFLTARRPFISRQMECSIHREDHILATYVQKSDIKSLIFSLKIYKQMHPDE